MTREERHQLALLSRRAYDLEVQLGMATHYVGNVEGGETDALDNCCERAREIREALERVGGIAT